MEEKGINKLPVPEGDVLEAVHDVLQEEMKLRKKAIANWKTMKFRVQMLQTFGWLKQINRQIRDQTENKCCSSSWRFVVKSDSRNKIIWDQLTSVAFLVSYILTPFNIAFSLDLTDEMREIELILDTIMLFDIFANFFTDKFSNPGQIISN